MADQDLRVSNEYRPLLLQAWIDNRMGADRTILSLSAGGIGLVVTLVVAFGAGGWRLVGFGLASASFLLAILIGLRVLHLNSIYIKAILMGKSYAEPERELARWTWWMRGLFVLGLILTSAVAALVA